MEERGRVSEPGRLLREGLQAGQSKYGRLRLSLPAYARAVLRRVRDRNGSADAAECAALLVRSELQDLYLAIACDRNRRRAWRVLARTVLEQVARNLARSGVDRARADALASSVPGHLVAARASRQGHGPFASYSGRSTLAVWLAGVALNVERSRRRAAFRRRNLLKHVRNLGPSALLDASPLKMAMDNEVVAAADAAVRRAFSRMGGRSASVLALYYAQGASQEHVARLLGVDQSTVSRKIAAAHRVLKQELAMSEVLRFVTTPPEAGFVALCDALDGALGRASLASVGPD